jgi:polysaccharide pyruvyl transferase CsaB
MGSMSQSSVPNVTIAAWAGSTNLGDELVLAALLAKLRARGVPAHVLSVDPAGTEARHGVSAGRSPRGGVPAGGPSAVLLGGGGLVQDETSPVNLPYHLGRALLAAGRSAPLAGIGLGAGPVTGAVGRRLVPRALARAVAVSVRDEASRQVLDDLGVRSRLAADLAVSLPLPRVEVEGRIGVSLRPWTGARGRLPVAMRRSRAATPPWFATGMAASLDAVAARTGLDVHFIALQADRDDAVHREVAARMAAPATSSRPDVHGLVDEVAACEVVVAMRYHAGIAALLGGRPAALLGYSPKVSSLAGDVPGGMVALTWDRGAVETLPTPSKGSSASIDWWWRHERSCGPGSWSTTRCWTT